MQFRSFLKVFVPFLSSSRLIFIYLPPRPLLLFLGHRIGRHLHQSLQQAGRVSAGVGRERGPSAGAEGLGKSHGAGFGGEDPGIQAENARMPGRIEARWTRRLLQGF